jgi:hypothetical protein
VTEAIVWCAYLVAVLVSAVALYLVDWRSMRFMDGILVGSVYYLVAPFVLILMHGELPPDFIKAPPYRPYSDLGTTTVVIGGMFLVAAMTILTRPVRRRVDETDRRILPTMLVIFALSSIYALVNSGILTGGHWYRATADALETSGSFLLIKHLANFSRTAIFGILLYWNLNRGMSRRRAIVIGVIIVLADLVMTFNRVTGVYFLIMIIIMYRRKFFPVATVIALMLFALPTVSNMWPMFRGIIGSRDYTVENIADAAVTAFERSNTDIPAVESLNGVFESVNIVVLNFVVTHSGTDLPLRKGEMFIRPFTFFLPAQVWANRPANFGSTLGQEINQTEDLALNSTLFGEPYANFGSFWWIALAGLLLGYEFLTRWLGWTSRVVGFIAAFTGFAMWRFDTVFEVISMVLTMLILMGLAATRSRVRRPARQGGAQPGAAGAAAMTAPLDGERRT